MHFTSEMIWLIISEIFAIIGSIGFGQKISAEENSKNAGIHAAVLLLAICQLVCFAPYLIDAFRA